MTVMSAVLIDTYMHVRTFVGDFFLTVLPNMYNDCTEIGYI